MSLIRNGNRLEYNAPSSSLPKEPDPKDTDPDHFYVNLTFFNNNTSNINVMNQTIPAKIEQTFSRDLIAEPDLWNASVVRFSIASDTVPRVTQVLGTTGGNTDLYVNLSYNGTFYDEPIVLPTYPNLSGAVQAVYQVNEFLDIINAAYREAQVEVALAGGPTGPTGVAAFMMFDPATSLYTMNVPVFYGTGSVGTSTTVGVGMSYQLYHKFGSFNVVQNDPILMNNIDDTFVKAVRGDNIVTLNYPSAGITGQYMQLRQDSPWGSSIEDVDRLLLTTQFLPVIKEYRAEQLY